MTATTDEQRAKKAEYARARRARLKAEKAAAAEAGPRYPSARINPEKSGSAYVLASRTRQQLRLAGATKAECAEFFADALDGSDREHTLSVVRRWVTVTR